MPITRTITLYRFDELTDHAKEQARDWYREANAMETDHLDFVLLDCERIGSKLGVEFLRRHNRTPHDTIVCNACIQYRGFGSQGDGACFFGTYAYAPNWRASLKAEIGGDDLDELTAIGQRLEEIQSRYGYALTAQITDPGGRYSHEQRPDIDVYDSRSTVPPITIEARRERSTAVAGCMRDLMRVFYRYLERAHNDETSDKTVSENIIANDYLFSENGVFHG